MLTQYVEVLDITERGFVRNGCIHVDSRFNGASQEETMAKINVIFKHNGN